MKGFPYFYQEILFTFPFPITCAIQNTQIEFLSSETYNRRLCDWPFHTHALTGSILQRRRIPWCLMILHLFFLIRLRLNYNELTQKPFTYSYTPHLNYVWWHPGINGSNFVLDIALYNISRLGFSSCMIFMRTRA